jgi:hypothetical protein
MGLKFRCSLLQIKEAYVNLGSKYISRIRENTDKQDIVHRQLLKLRRIVGAYQLLTDPESQSAYIKAIRIRSILSQQPISYRDEREGCHYPYMMFVVTESDSILMLEIDFIGGVIYLRKKDHEKTEYSFNQIQSVLQGKDHDEFIIEFYFKKKNKLSMHF